MSFASSFAAGQKLGNGLVGTYNDGVAQRRQAVLDQRDTDEYEYKVGERKKIQTSNDNIAALLNDKGVGTNTSGLSDGSASALYSRAGGGAAGQQAVDDAAGSGNLEAARTGLQRGANGALPYTTSGPAEYTAPDPSAPAQVGLSRTAPNATFTPGTKGPSDRAVNAAMLQNAIVRGDMTAAAGMQAKDRGYGVQEVSDAAAKTPMADIRSSLGNLNIGQMTGMPISYVGEKTDSKGKSSGYNFVTYDGQGKPSAFTLNEDQLRQMHVGSQLSAAGYGEEAHKVMSAVNKEAADHVKDYNDNMYKQVSTNNQGQYQSDSSEQQRAQLAETGRHNRASEGIQAASVRNSGGGGGDKKDDPKDVAALNALQDAYANEPDRTKQEVLRRQYNSLTSKMATLRGKTVPLREDRASGETDPTKYYGAVKAAVESGIYKTPQEAQMAVDAAYGRVAPSAVAVNPGLQKLNGGAPSAATRPQPTAVQVSLGMPNSNEPVPEPPQQYRNVGLTRVANPEFQNWQQTYGAEYDRQQAYAPTLRDKTFRAAMETSRSAAKVAPSGYNPYVQNRVR